jgi:hypothetical protein
LIGFGGDGFVGGEGECGRNERDGCGEEECKRA